MPQSRSRNDKHDHAILLHHLEQASIHTRAAEVELDNLNNPGKTLKLIDSLRTAQRNLRAIYNVYAPKELRQP